MPGRSYSCGDGYRFGFQGQETDDEVRGDGNSLDFGARIYNPQIGRFLTVDPLQTSYPYNSPYAFAENKVIEFEELEGLQNPARPNIRKPGRGYYTKQRRLYSENVRSQQKDFGIRNTRRRNRDFREMEAEYFKNYFPQLESFQEKLANDVNGNTTIGKFVYQVVELIDNNKEFIEVLQYRNIDGPGSPGVKVQTIYQFKDPTDNAKIYMLEQEYNTIFSGKLNLEIDKAINFEKDRPIVHSVSQEEKNAFKNNFQKYNAIYFKVKNSLGSSPKELIDNFLKDESKNENSEIINTRKETYPTVSSTN